MCFKEVGSTLYLVQQNIRRLLLTEPRELIILHSMFLRYILLIIFSVVLFGWKVPGPMGQFSRSSCEWHKKAPVKLSPNTLRSSILDAREVSPDLRNLADKSPQDFYKTSVVFENKKCSVQLTHFLVAHILEPLFRNEICIV